MIYIGIDPGVRMCGVAIEHARKIDRRSSPGLTSHVEQIVRSAFLVRSKADTLAFRGLHMAHEIMQRFPEAWDPVTLCVEGQQVYRSEKSKGDPNNMVALATVAGLILGSLHVACVDNIASIAMPLPREWKGTIKKEIHHERLARDFPHWVAAVQQDTPKSMQHHVWDAVGLLEWHKERSTR